MENVWPKVHLSLTTTSSLPWDEVFSFTASDLSLVQITGLNCTAPNRIIFCQTILFDKCDQLVTGHGRIDI